MSRCVYLVPEDIVNSWRSGQRLQSMDFPKRKVISDLDTKISKELQRTDLTDREKMFSHGQQLGELFNQRNTSGLAPPPLPTSPPAANQLPSPQHGSDSLDMIHVPYRLKNRAKKLRDALKMSPDLSWDSQNVLYIKGKKIEGSNFSDLLHDAVRSQPAPESPTGASALKSYLESEGLSKSYLHNKSWKSSKPIENASASVYAPAKRSGTDLSTTPILDAPAYKKVKAVPPINWESFDEETERPQRLAKLSAGPKIKGWLQLDE